jgi:hypothetical protein
MKTKPLSMFTRKTLGLVLILLLTASGSGGQFVRAETASSETPALVRIDLASLDDLQLIAETSFQPLALMTTPTGQDYLLGLAEPSQRTNLFAQGFALTILDPDSRGAVYYLAHAMPGRSLEPAQSLATVLLQDGPEAVVRALPAQAEKLPEFGIKIARLGPEPIALPIQPADHSFPSSILPDPIIAGMIDQIDIDRVLWPIERLTGVEPAIIDGSPYTILTRNTYSGTPIQKATQFVSEYFQTLGLEVEMHNWSNPNYPNVIATIPAEGDSDEIIIITAHMDDMPSGPIAPGADDNASGTTAVMIAAELFSQLQWSCTVRFIAFTGEEQGLLGSAAYALRSYDLGEDITGVLNLDMIAYNSDAYPIVDLHARSWLPGSVAMANLFADVVDVYGINLTPHVLIDHNLGNYSDNKSFWDRGYNAILGIEDYDDFTPYYHTVNDHLDTLDMDYFVNYIKASIGTFAHMGCLSSSTGTLVGTISDTGTGQPLEGVAVEARTLDNEWSTISGDDGSYSLALPEDTYEVSASLPGYMDYYNPEIVVTEALTTTLDFTLERIFFTVSGTVLDIFTGQPLQAQISLSDPWIDPVGTDPLTGSYSMLAPSGTYTLTTAAEGYQPISRQVTIDADQEQDFELETICLLVVDGSGDLGYLDFYTLALDRLDLSYTAVNSLSDLDALASYRGVIWFAGDNENVLPSEDLETMSAYLDGGGRLLLSGQYINQEIGQTSFFQDYLHAEVISGTTSVRTMIGLDFLAGTNPTITEGDGANNQISPGIIQTLPKAVGILRYAGTGLHSGAAYQGLYRTVYFPFGYEAINKQSHRDKVMWEVINYLGACQAPTAPVASFIYEPLEHHDEIGFSNTSRGTPFMTYAWDFGDGTLSSTTNAEHVYLATGTYTVTLTATNPYGSNTYTTPITITPYQIFLPLMRQNLEGMTDLP